MPDNLKRYQATGNFHFLTFSCHGRNPYLSTRKICEIFESALETVRRRYVFAVVGYLIMPEHVHLLVSEPRRLSLDRAIQALKTSVSKRSPVHPFWLPRYYDFNVHSEQKRREKLRYIHRNPVARGLVERPDEWEWSSYQNYLTGKPGTVEVENHWALARRLGISVLVRSELSPGWITAAHPSDKNKDVARAGHPLR